MLDYLGVLKALNETGVRYVLVGGVAVNMHGVPRMTYDLDLLVDLEDENLEKLVALLNEWGFKPRIPVAIENLASQEKRQEWVTEKHMKAFNVFNDQWALSEIDILIDSPVSYASASEHATPMRLGGVDVPLISIDDLVVMKKGTGRAQDEADIRYLERIRDEQRGKDR